VDGLIGGIPCQPHSLAGRKRGSLDDRDLWSTARRIIVQSRAWFVLIENVVGMLSAGDDEIAGAERICRDLRKLGFTVEAGLFTASEGGASHERKRLVILAVANGIDQQWGGGPNTSRQRQGELGPGDGCFELADTFGRGRWAEGDGSKSAEIAVEAGEPMVDAEGVGRRKRRSKPEFRTRRTASAIPSAAVGNTNIVEFREQPSAWEQSLIQYQHGTCGKHLFPPRPDDIESWRSALAASPELEPAFRRVADGLASRVDIGRLDRLRMLGNGVVPLQAAYALRTLCTRLAARGSSGAVELVRLMEIAA
jgi:DNA (cytosine-5)-methyltransferase 1